MCSRALPLVAALLVVAVPSAPALDLEELVALGFANNLQLATARSDLEAAIEALPFESDLADSVLRLTGSYEATSAGEDLSGSAQLTVPIIPQVSLGATATSSATGTLSVTLTPFAQLDPDYVDREVFRKAALEMAYQEARLRADIEAAALSVLRSGRAVADAAARLALEEEVFEVTGQSYELGAIAFDQLEDVRGDVLAARQQRFDALRAQIRATADLRRLIGLPGRELAVDPLGLDRLVERIGSRHAAAAAALGQPPASLALARLRIELEALQAELRTTALYRPNLSATAGVDFDLQPNASVTFSFSPADIKRDQRDELNAELQTTSRALELEQLNAILAASVLEQSLAVAAEQLEQRHAELAQVRTALGDAQLLAELGERTTLEVERARVAEQAAETAAIAAAAGVLAAQSDLLIVSALAVWER